MARFPELCRNPTDSKLEIGRLKFIQVLSKSVWPFRNSIRLVRNSPRRSETRPNDSKHDLAHSQFRPFIQNSKRLSRYSRGRSRIRNRSFDIQLVDPKFDTTCTQSSLGLSVPGQSYGSGPGARGSGLASSQDSRRGRTDRSTRGAAGHVASVVRAAGRGIPDRLPPSPVTGHSLGGGRHDELGVSPRDGW